MKCTKYCGDLSWQIITKVLSGQKTEDKVLSNRYLHTLIQRESVRSRIISKIIDNYFNPKPNERTLIVCQQSYEVD
jgi:acetone carboxylase gamma subunit